MFFKIGSLKNFTIFTGIHLYWGLFLTYFFEKRLLTGVSCGYCKILKTSFLYRTPPVAASDSPTIKSAGVTVY